MAWLEQIGISSNCEKVYIELIEPNMFSAVQPPTRTGESYMGFLAIGQRIAENLNPIVIDIFFFLKSHSNRLQGKCLVYCNFYYKLFTNWRENS
jgi:hypothetical protein